jgi:phage host-nuclease inhibitor protein Gam
MKPHQDPIRTRTQAEQQLKQVAHLLGLLGLATAQRDQEVLDVQTKHGALIESIAADIQSRKAALEEWARENRQEFGESKTLKLPDGDIFFHLGQRKIEYLPDWNPDRSLEKLLDLEKRYDQWSAYVRRNPEIDKRKLLEDTKGDKPVLAPKRLQVLGLEVTRDEHFDWTVRPGPACFDVSS